MENNKLIIYQVNSMTFLPKTSVLYTEKSALKWLYLNVYIGSTSSDPSWDKGYTEDRSEWQWLYVCPAVE